MLALAFIPAAYLVGAIPFGLIVGRVMGRVDVRAHGSGNIGFTNVYRVLGPGPGFLVLALDMGKGFLSVWAPQLVYRHPQTVATDGWVVVACALAAVVGHSWPVYLRFKGGKGVATGAGTVLAFVPLVTVALLLIWGLVVAATRYVSLASIAAVGLFPVMVAIFYPGNVPYLVFGLVGAAAVIFRHRANIGRLLKGEESKVGSKA